MNERTEGTKAAKVWQITKTILVSSKECFYSNFPKKVTGRFLNEHCFTLDLCFLKIRVVAVDSFSGSAEQFNPTFWDSLINVQLS